jgi:flagellin-like protein
MASKGISPLVASVLLIAITMTVAGVLALWATGFVKERTGAFNATSPECDFAHFRIYSCTYNSNTSTINLILNNEGNVELKSLTAFIIYSNNSVSETPLTGTLPPNTLKSYSIPGVASDYTSLTIRTHCPQVSASGGCR